MCAACSVSEHTGVQAQAVGKPSAAAVLHELQGAFLHRYEALPTAEQQLTNDTSTSTRSEPVLRSSSLQLDSGAHLSPRRAGAASVTMPLKASGRVRAQSAGVAIETSLRDVRADADAELAEGYVLYRESGPTGGHVLLRASEDGIEDFVTFETAPNVPSLKYQLELVHDVAGLRLVDGTLEILDAAGAPRLRARRPFVVDANGKAAAADLRVEGCAVDLDPRPPWKRATTPPGARSCTVVVSWSNAGLRYPAIVDPAWTATGTLVEPRADHTLTLLDSGRILAAGGVNSGPTQPGAELYDPGSGTWSATGAPNQRRTNHIAAKLPSGPVLIAGGTPGLGALSSAETYSEATGMWTPTGSMNHARQIFIGELLPDGRVLVAGGYAGRGIRSSAELYDPSAGTWSFTGSMSTARGRHRSSATQGGTVLVSGGMSSAYTYLSSAERYSQTTGMWSAAGAMSQPRVWHAQAALAGDSKVIVAGGSSNGSSFLAGAEIYDRITNTWSSAPSLTVGRRDSVGFMLHNGTVLFAGGQTDSGYVSSSDLYTPVPSQTTATTPMTTARSRYGVAHFATGNTKALVAGGYDGTSYLTASELFDVASSAATSTSVSDGWSLPRISLTWDDTEGLTGSYSSSYTINAKLTNNDSVGQNVYVDLTAIGLDDRVVTRSAYFDVALGAGATTNLAIPATAFPIRPVGSEAQLLLSARPYVLGSGPTGESFEVNTKLFYEFTPTYANVVFHGANGADLDRNQPPSSSTYAQWLTSTSAMRDALASVAGQVWVTDAFVDVGALAPAPHGRHAEYAMKGQWAKDLDTLLPTIPITYTPPIGAKYYKLCASWRVSYDDAGYGEARLAAKGLQISPAAYANYLVSYNNDTVSLGQLDAEGCTPAMLLGNTDTFELMWETQMKKGTTTLRVTNGPYGEWCNPDGLGGCYVSLWGLYPPWFVSSITTQDDGGLSPTSAPKYDNNASFNENATRAAAVLDLTLALSDNGLLPATTYTAYASTGCFADQFGVMGEACGSNGVLSLGKGFTYDLMTKKPTANGTHTSFAKFTIAHEFGHIVADDLFGTLYFALKCKDCMNGPCTGVPAVDGEPLARCQEGVDGLPAVDDFKEYKCRCDYVTAGNQFHCMESKELQGFANNEGVGHFYAANLFNDTSSSQCTFVYYKDAWVWQTQLSGYGAKAPPVAMSCYWTANPERWFKDECGLLPTKKGVEWDWLAVLYELHNKTSNAYTFDEIRQVYRTACRNDPDLRCLRHSVFFDESPSGSSNPGAMSLKDASNTIFGMGSQKANHLLTTATKHGVNNN